MNNYYYEEVESEHYELDCPYCDTRLEYCIADGLPECEFIQCHSCDNWLSVTAEPVIEWRTWSLASIQLLVDIGDYKKGDVVHTNCTNSKGVSQSKNSFIDGKFVDENAGKRFYKVLELNERYVECQHFKWLGFCNNLENDQNLS